MICCWPAVTLSIASAAIPAVQHGTTPLVSDPASTVVILEALAVPVILLFFYLDGMVLGKVTPPAAFYIAYVAFVSPEMSTLVVVAVMSVIASSLGQFTLYRGFNTESPEFIGIRRAVPYADRLPWIIRRRVGDKRMQVVTRLFERFGGFALAVTNTIPLIRSLMSIPAGMSRYSRTRFLVFSTIGNAVYLVFLTAVAEGIVDVAIFVR